MTQSLATQNGSAPPPRRLDPYSAGLSAEAPRVDALAVISCGYRDQKSNLPHASQAGEAAQIYLHDPHGRAPKLAEAIARGEQRQLLITFPFDDPRQFVVQRFTRYSASRLELYGDETAITEIISGKPPEHRTHIAGTAEYERLVRTCKADTRVYFCLAEWGADGPEVVFPDGLGTYAIRTTSAHSVRSILGTLAYTARFTQGRIAGLPFLLTVDHREVAGPDGAKHNIPVWTITTKPPEGARLSSRTFRDIATSALREGAQLMLPPPDERTWEELEADGPLVVEEPSERDMEVLESGGLCDADFYRRAWHALAQGTAFASDDARAAFIDSFSDGRTDSLTEFLRAATEARASALISALGAAVTNQRRQERGARYDEIFKSNYGDTVEVRVGQSNPDRSAVSSEAHNARISSAPTRTDDTADGPATEKMIDSPRSAIYQRYMDLVEEAQRMEVEYEAFSTPVAEAKLTVAGVELKARLEAKKRQLAGQQKPAAEAAQQEAI